MQIAEFAAVIASSVSAVKIGDDGAGRVTFEVPESDLPELLKVIAFGREKCLRVKVDCAD